MFRPSHVRRVAKILEDALPPPYEAEVQLEEGRVKLRVVIMDPDEPDLAVAQAWWEYDEAAAKLGMFPREAELKAIADRLSTVCTEYPARKAAAAVEKADREARRAANLEARAADAVARAEAEKALKSAAAKVLAADDITEPLVEDVRKAASDRALAR